MTPNSYRFFNNSPYCKYWPCHTDLVEINCKFCFCPIYQYENCGGDYFIDGGVKNCSRCNLPHKAENYDYIVDFLIGVGAAVQK
jgi:Zn-finger protein